MLTHSCSSRMGLWAQEWPGDHRAHVSLGVPLCWDAALWSGPGLACRLPKLLTMTYGPRDTCCTFVSSMTEGQCKEKIHNLILSKG